MQDLICGNDVMDYDHAQLMLNLNVLKKKHIENVVEMLCQDIDLHSSHEEHLMYDSKYDMVEVVLHLADHHTRFELIKKHVAAGEIDEAIASMEKHIKKYDIPLGKWLNQQKT